LQIGRQTLDMIDRLPVVAPSKEPGDQVPGGNIQIIQPRIHTHRHRGTLAGYQI
jgi:hypothetical protein